MKQFPLFYDNYFVPRGYAVVQVDISGTNKSTGCLDIGGPAEIGSVKAVIDWLNGRAEAYPDLAATAPAVPVSWHNGKTGMIGKSWDGTMANGVAATGVDGLATIVPISAIDSWYDYYRYNGTRYGSSPLSLHNQISKYASNDPTCAATKAELTAGNSADGNYTDFWAARDYTKDAAKVKASVFVVHGFGDMNVKPNNFDKWWNALAANNVPRKIWAHQYGHVDPFEFDRAAWVDTLQRWFDYWLQGIDNGIMAQPQARVQTSPTTFENAVSWPVPGAAGQKLTLSAEGTLGRLGIEPTAPSTATFRAASISETTMIADPTTASTDRLKFLTPVFTNPVRISGSPKIDLTISADQADANLTFLLVDLGPETNVSSRTSGEGVGNLTTRSCWGESTGSDSACFLEVKTNTVQSTSWILSRGWMSATHADSLATRTPLTPGQQVGVSWAAMPNDWTVKSGHRLAVILAGNDSSYTSNVSPVPNITVQLDKSSITLPIVGHPVPEWVGTGENYQTILAKANAGGLTLSIPATPISMTPAQLTGVDQIVTGALNTATVADARGTAGGWDLTGQVSDFTSGSGRILADNLGWDPQASVVTGTLPVAGEVRSAVEAGAPAAPGAGLGTVHALCRAQIGTSAGAFSCTAALRLGLPGSMRAGEYSGVLTLTLI